MAEVIKLFLSHVFDSEGVSTETYIENNVLVQDKVLSSPLFINNMIFNKLWAFLFGAFPPRRISDEFMKSNISCDSLETLLNAYGGFGVIRFMIANNQFDINNIKKKFTEIKATTISKASKKRYIIEKICERFDVPFKPDMEKANLIVFFVEIITNSECEESMDDIPNPISLRKPSGINAVMQTSIDKNKDAILGDLHFIRKLVQQPCIFIDDTITHNDINITGINKIIDIFKDDKKKPVLFNASKNVQAITLFGKSCYVYDISLDTIKLVPRLFEHFICISNKMYPTIHPLCVESKNAIYYLRAWSRKDVINNDIQKSCRTSYDRYITNIPFKGVLSLTNKVYRIFDPISSHIMLFSGTKVLIGQRSQPPDSQNSNTPIRTDVYTPTNKHINYTRVIDTFDDIPLSKKYEYAANGADVDAGVNTDFYKSNPTIMNVIFSPEMFEHSWKEHIKYSCPTKNAHPMNNCLVFFEGLISYLHGKDSREALFEPESKNAIILIDNRENPMSVLSIMLALINVQPRTWSCKVYTSVKATKYYKHYLNIHGVQVVPYPDLDTTNFDIDTYNAVLKSPQFWKSLGDHEKVLIIQDDGLLLRKGVESFLHYDYIGAPWGDYDANTYIKNNINSELVGNGGFSLRDVAKSLHITEKYEAEKWDLFYDNNVEMPEDVYFVKCMIKEKYKVAKREDAVKFATEQVYNPNSLGIHKFWAYCPCEQVEKLI